MADRERARGGWLLTAVLSFVRWRPQALRRIASTLLLPALVLTSVGAQTHLHSILSCEFDFRLPMSVRVAIDDFHYATRPQTGPCSPSLPSAMCSRSLCRTSSSSGCLACQPGLCLLCLSTSEHSFRSPSSGLSSTESPSSTVEAELTRLSCCPWLRALPA